MLENVLSPDTLVYPKYGRKGLDALTLCVKYVLEEKVWLKCLSSHLISSHHADPNSRSLRILYVRYADDWILLSNANRQICERWKGIIKDYLFNSLGATLAEDKTHITDIREKPAHFLGFELRRRRKGRLMYAYKGNRWRLTRSPGLLVYAFPDRQRMNY